MRTKQKQTIIHASQWRTWQACALSLTLRNDAPFADDKDLDEYAVEGIALHKAIEADLKSESRPRLDDSQEAIVGFAVRAAQAEADGKQILSEQQKKIKVKDITFACVADALIDNDDELIVVDFKTGWRAVQAEANTQLKIYAHAFRKKNHKVWRGVIINARLNTIEKTTRMTFEKNYLSTLAQSIKERIQNKQNATGAHCAYCSGLSICAPFRRALKKWTEPGVEDGIKNRVKDWAELLTIAKPVETLLKRVKNDALKYIELGGQIPGVAIDYKNGNRAWPKDMTINDIANALGIKPQDLLAEPDIISPAEAEKKGIAREKINAIVIQPPRKTLKILA